MHQGKRSRNMGVGLAFGITIGALFGVAMDNMPFGIAIGVAIGVGVGASGVFGTRKRGPADGGSNEAAKPEDPAGPGGYGADGDEPR